MATRKKKLDPLAVTSGLAIAITELNEIEPMLNDHERAVVSNHRIGVEMAMRDVMRIVGEYEKRRLMNLKRKR